MHKTLLEAKVAAVNNAHRYAKQLFPILAAFLSPYVGQKVENKDGSLIKRIKDSLPAFPPTDLPFIQLNVFRYMSDYNLAWTVKACETYPTQHLNAQCAVYHETILYVGDLRDGILTTLNDPPDYLRDDYTVEEIEEKRRIYQEAKRVADEARDDLHYFGE